MCKSILGLGEHLLGHVNPSLMKGTLQEMFCLPIVSAPSAAPVVDSLLSNPSYFVPMFGRNFRNDANPNNNANLITTTANPSITNQNLDLNSILNGHQNNLPCAFIPSQQQQQILQPFSPQLKGILPQQMMQMIEPQFLHNNLMLLGNGTTSNNNINDANYQQNLLLLQTLQKLFGKNASHILSCLVQHNQTLNVSFNGNICTCFISFIMIYPFYDEYWVLFPESCQPPPRKWHRNITTLFKFIFKFRF